MNVLIVFNHPAPYKVKIFNEIANYCNLTVIFEREKAGNRNNKFYSSIDYKFNAIILKDRYIGNEGSLSDGVKKYISEHHKEFDFIIMNGYSHGAEIKAINYMIQSKIKYGIMINGAIKRERESLIRKQLKTKFISHASYFLSPTDNSSLALAYYGADKRNIYKYVYSNISKSDIGNYVINSNETRNTYGIPLDKFVFINSSQFIKRKNNLQLIKLFKESNDFLLLVGEGNELNVYKNYIDKNKIKNVIILPFQTKENLFKILGVCDCFITLSKEDIFGHTTIEALANGLPVISSNKVNSSLEYIHNGYNGYIVNLKNNEIVKAMENVKDLHRKDAIESVKDITCENSAMSIIRILGSLK